MTTPTPTTSVVVVSFHSEETLAAAARSVPTECELIVVEQAGGGHAAEVLAGVHPKLHVIRAGGNRGFGAGCNLGAANTTGEVLIFLNPDATFEPGACQSLSLAAASQRAIVAPTLLDHDGQEATQARKFSRPILDAARLLLPQAWTPNWLSKDVPQADERYERGGRVPYAQGACFAIRRDLFFECGGFDERYFIYGEEEHLARSVENVGGSTLLLPTARVAHVGQTSTDRVAGFAVEQYFRSQLLRYRSDGGRLRAGIGALLLAASVALLAVTLPVRKLVGFRPSEDAAWCRAAFHGIASGARERPVRPPGFTPAASDWR